MDGSGDAQWADIYYDSKVEIPRLISEFRKTENLLRPIVDNAVAHHTRMPLRYHVESPPDRVAREKALIDALFANWLSQQQDFNGLFTDALYMAMPAGFCPVHTYWRDGVMDQYEPTPGQAMMLPTRPGSIDCWVGNPFDTVFDAGAKRGSIRWASYGRWLPAKAIRAAFGHIPGVQALQGGTKIPSASQFQKIARDWRIAGLGVHGSPIIEYRRNQTADEKMLYLICRETLPGVDADFPEGRLQIVAVPGDVDLRRGMSGSASGALTLVDQPLPAGDFSWTLFYSHFRGDDVLGKPWVEDLDQLQVDLNIALSKRWEILNKMANAPIVGPGGALSEDMMDFGDGYTYMEIEPSLAAWRPRVMEWPSEILAGLNREVEERRKALYTIGGYQAASRGEAPGSRMAYRAILALQAADGTIHAPVNERFRRSACDFARRCWQQFKTYADVPWTMSVVGDEYAYLVDPYIDKTKVSDRPPDYRLVNAFGATPEMLTQELLELMQVRGADGEVLLTTDEARRQWPSPTLFGSRTSTKSVTRRRARTVAVEAHKIAQDLREQTGLEDDEINSPNVQQAAQFVFAVLEKQYPRLRDDDLKAHIEVYSETTQDETADPIARVALMRRQDLYYEWQAAQAMPAAPAVQQAGSTQRQPAAARPRGFRTGQDRREVAGALGGNATGPVAQEVEQAVQTRSPNMRVA